MLKTIDSYIIKKYLGTFFFTMMLITMIALVIDFPERIDKFLSGPMTLKEILVDYYLNFIPWINGLLWPLFALMAVIFFTSRMAKDTEFVAMLSAGTSYYRILVPYLIAGGVITLIHLYANNVIIPISTKIKGEFENTYLRESQKKVLSDNVFFYLNPNTVAYFRYYRKRDTSALDFRMEDYRNGKLTQVLVADQIKLKKEPNTWTISDYYIRRIKDTKETLIVKKGEAIDTVLNLYPNDFIHYDNLPLLLTSGQMKKYIEYEKQKGLSSATKLKVELQRRNADPISILFLTILGFAIAARKSREGLGWNLALGVAIGGLYIVAQKFSITYANSVDINPVLAVWLPNIVFGIISIYMLIRGQK
ncbi:MAG: LptF/LptG family permease [Deltaproteobacteria bacterium]